MLLIMNYGFLTEGAALCSTAPILMKCGTAQATALPVGRRRMPIPAATLRLLTTS